MIISNNQTITPGDEFDWLTAIKPIKGGKFWECKCKCGKTTKASKWHLNKGLRRSCGCRLHTPPENYICTICDLEKPRSEFYIRPNGRLFHRKCKGCVINTQKQYQIQRRIKILLHYGNGELKCKCCGESHIEFLHLDHIGGWRLQHHAIIRANHKHVNIWKWLIKYKLPDLPLRILCANCNLSLGNRGYCPHNNPEINATVQCDKELMMKRLAEIVKTRIKPTIKTKHYNFIDPKGNPTTTTNLSAFCKKMNLHYSTMSKVSIGTRQEYNGWTKNISDSPVADRQ